jgi:hypothetical protein
MADGEEKWKSYCIVKMIWLSSSGERVMLLLAKKHVRDEKSRSRP